MKIDKHVLLLLFILLTSCTKHEKSGSTYTNPLFVEGCYPQASFYQGNYYYTMQQPNGDEIAIWKTTDITKVAEAKPTTVWTPKDSLAKYHLWSPEIHRIGNKWYIYFEADDGNTDNHQLYVIENDSPDPTKGKFHLKGAIITNSEWNWGIHPTTFVNKGKQYLLWSGWPKRRIEAETQCIYIASMKNPWTLDSKRVMISYPKYEWERQWINPNGMRAAYPIYVNENPECFFSRDKKKVLIFYSASGCWTNYNCEGMLSADVNNDLLNPASWIKSKEPVFMQSKRNGLFGPASVSFIPSPDKDEWFILYQAKTVAKSQSGTMIREGSIVNSIRLQKVNWNSQRMPVLGKPAPTDSVMSKPSGTE